MIRGVMMGRLGREPRAIGEDGCGLVLACDRYDYQKKEKVATWVDVTVWGKRGEWARKLEKGQALVVSGEIFTEDYEKDGVKRQKLCCRADSVDFVIGGQK